MGVSILQSPKPFVELEEMHKSFHRKTTQFLIKKRVQWTWIGQYQLEPLDGLYGPYRSRETWSPDRWRTASPKRWIWPRENGAMSPTKTIMGVAIAIDPKSRWYCIYNYIYYSYIISIYIYIHMFLNHDLGGEGAGLGALLSEAVFLGGNQIPLLYLSPRAHKWLKGTMACPTSAPSETDRMVPENDRRWMSRHV